MATLSMTETERAELARFQRDVVEPSMSQLVIVDFWAEWCGPCKQLGPVLEKIVINYAARGVVLVKIDVDADKFIAAQFQIQSIPTVYALFQGQPVADLSKFRTEGQLTRALDQLLAQLPIKGAAQDLAAEIEPLIAMGEQLLDEGDATRAASTFEQIRGIDPANPAAIGGLARALLARGEVDKARILLDELPQDAHAQPAISRALAALDVAAAPVADIGAEQARLAANPDNHEARLALANALMAQGDRDGAAEALLDIVARDREWNGGAARARLLQLLEAAGLADPWARAQRRRLSALLFT